MAYRCGNHKVGYRKAYICLAFIVGHGNICNLDARSMSLGSQSIYIGLSNLAGCKLKPAYRLRCTETRGSVKVPVEVVYSKRVGTGSYLFVVSSVSATAHQGRGGYGCGT